MKILVTGGAGYIGSHTVIELMLYGYDVIVIDNLSNSSVHALRRVEDIVGRSLSFIQGDIRDEQLLGNVFLQNEIKAVIHFAGLKAVGESVINPIVYYDNNVAGSLALCNVMRKNNCKILVFSSSATVYGDPDKLPIKENSALRTTNPYGNSKLMVENILRDIQFSDPKWSIGLLRYFNPVGAHQSGKIGEDPRGRPNNLMPFIAQVAAGKCKKLKVFGGDYATKDGTGVRDYIHVIDLAKGHLAALNKLLQSPTLLTVNLGTGHGYSVLEVISAFEVASNRQVPYEVGDRRQGDIAECYADPSHAQNILGWKAALSLHQMCEDAWRWQSNNPNGYEG